MKSTIISYSLTGNNEKLATILSTELSAEHIKVTESRKRSFFTIGIDMLFNRTPKILQSMKDVDTNGFVIFVGPVWMGFVASPLRACFKDLKGKIGKYAFVSLSGGADGPNTKLGKDLKKRMGKKPSMVLDNHIAKLLPSDPPPTRKETSDYRLNDEDTRKLTEEILGSLKDHII